MLVPSHVALPTTYPSPGVRAGSTSWAKVIDVLRHRPGNTALAIANNLNKLLSLFIVCP